MADKPAPTEPKFISVEGMIEAPVIFFEICPTFGNNAGLINIMMATGLVEPNESGQVSSRIKAVAHLRMTAASAINLRDAINKALLLGAAIDKPVGKAN